MSSATPAAIPGAVLIVQHEPNDGPCSIAEFFEARGVPFCIFEMVPPIEDKDHVYRPENFETTRHIGDDSNNSAGIISLRDYGFAADRVRHESLLPADVDATFEAAPAAKYPRRDRSAADITTFRDPPFAHQLTPVAGGTALALCGGATAFRIAAVIVLGGYMSVNDKLPYFEQKIFGLYRTAIQANISTRRRVPVLGICLGCQLLATALGGATVPSDNPELGWIESQLLPNDVAVPRRDRDAATWFVDGAASLTIIQTHGEKAQFPPTPSDPAANDFPACRLIATNDTCPQQAFQVGDLPVVATQFHPECDEHKLRYYLAVTWPGVVMHREEYEEARRIRGAAFPKSLQCIQDILNPELLQARLSANRAMLDNFLAHWWGC